MAKDKPELSKEDYQTKVWSKFKTVIEYRIERLRLQNDAINSSEIDTAVRRGQIAELKALLMLDAPNIPLPSID